MYTSHTLYPFLSHVHPPVCFLSRTTSKHTGLITAGSKVMGAVQTFLLEAAEAIVRSFDLAEPWKLDEGRTPKVRGSFPRVLS